MSRKFTLFVPPYVGEGAFLELGDLVKSLGVTKALLVCDPGLKDLRLRAEDVLGGAGVACVSFTGVVPEPTDLSIIDGAKIGREAGGIDGVVGIGGGSAMDTAKCINVLLNNPGTLWDYAVTGGKQKTAQGFPLVLVPTTSGTGAECTYSAIFTHSESHKKMSIRSDNCCLAKAAVIDPAMTLRLPRHLTVASGVDALCHAAEALTVSNTNPVSDALAKEAIRLIAEHLPHAVIDGHLAPESREAMGTAAMLAGMAFSNTLLHLVHAIGHSLGAVLRQPHGLMVGQALPYVMSYIAQVAPERVAAVGACMGLSIPEGMPAPEIGATVGQRLYDFFAEIGFPSLQDLGFTLEQALEAAPYVPLDGCFSLGVRTMTDSQIKEAIEKIYFRELYADSE